MAVELAVGYVSVVPSGRGFGRSLINMGTTAGASAGTAASTSFGSRFTEGMSRVAKRAAVAFTAGLGTAGFFAIRTAANFEQTRIAFEGILGDVEQANDLLGDLRRFAAKTPFEFAGLSEAARSLLAVGFSADDVIPTMTTLGNVAATLGVGETEIQGVIRALGQMKGKGKASAEELQQISEQIPGFSAIKEIAEDMGISTAEAFDRMAAGAIPADDAIESILNGMETFPGAVGAMDRQSKTLNGVLSTLKDTIANVAIDFITPYLPAISDGVRAFGGFVEDLAGKLKELIESEGFKDFKATVGGIITDGLEAILSFWDRNGEAIIQWFRDFGEVAGGVLSTIGDFIWQTVLPALEQFGSWFFEDGPGIQILIAGLAGAFAVYAFNAALAAVATLLAIAPLVIFAVIVGFAVWATQKLIDEFNLLPKAAELVQWAIDNLVTPILDLVEALENAIEKFSTLRGMFGGNAGKSAADFLRGQRNGNPEGGGAPWFDEGGVMPGRKGVHYPAWVAGGETVLPTHDTPMPALGGAAMIGSLSVTQMPGEDAVSTAMRELRRITLLVGA
jgi:tape measure domain-containing protein